jgi:hypothetical protein
MVLFVGSEAGVTAWLAARQRQELIRAPDQYKPIEITVHLSIGKCGPQRIERLLKARRQSRSGR